MGIFLKSRAGILPIIIAVMIVSLLAAMSLMMSLTSGMSNKRVIATLDRKEAFYSNEIAAWHSYFRVKGSLTPGSAFTIDNRYVLTLTLAADSYDAGKGSPLNLATTKEFAPTPNLIRRYQDGAIGYRAPSGAQAGYCGHTNFGGKKNRHQLCLSSPPKPKGAGVLAAWGGDLEPITQKPRKWIIAKIGSDNQLDPSFGNAGKVELPVSDPSAEPFGPFHGAVSLAMGKNGSFYMHSGDGVHRFFSDGRLDTSFGNHPTGPLSGLFSFSAWYVKPIHWSYILPRSADSILVWSDAPSPVLLFDPFHGQFGALALDPLFANGNEGRILTVKPKTDGGLLVAGSTTADHGANFTYRLIQLKSGGEVDPSFDDGGSTGFNLIDLVLDAQGNSLSYGQVVSQGVNLSVCRRTPNGVLDGSFGTAGCNTANFFGAGTPDLDRTRFFGDSQLLAVITPSEGMATLPLDQKIVLKRYGLDWTPDTSFGTNGETVVPAYPIMHCDMLTRGQSLMVLGLQKMGDGSTLIALRVQATGTNCKKMAFVKLDTNGKTDESFGKDGTRIIDIGANYFMSVGWLTVE